jgi:rhodanese-related sulfurtransferase
MAQDFNTQVAEAKAAISSVTPEQAAALQNRSDVVFVDPRPAEAIASTTGIIPGAYNVGLADIVAGKLPEKFADQSIHVVTACQGGPMGAVAAHNFSKLGFSNVNYVEGGTGGWVEAGYPTER